MPKQTREIRRRARNGPRISFARIFKLKIASATTQKRLTATDDFVDSARGLFSHGAKVLVVQDAVDAAVRVIETRGSADRAAPCTTALGAPEGAAGFAAAVFTFEASHPVAALRNWTCF